jgi:hypothetical protein
MRRQLLVAVVTLPLLGLTTPASGAEPTLVVGLWPQTYAQFLDIEAASGVSLPYFRGRQRDGQFDSQLVPPDAAAAAAAGYSLGMNIQPKTGSGGNRTGIRYTDITAQLQAGSGPYYAKLVSFANEVLALPTYGQVTHYLQFHSEANLQAAPGVLDSQPYSGTGAEYRECFALVRALFDSMGVTDRIVWQVVLTRAAYEGNGGGPSNWFPADTSLYDLVGVDSYRRPNTWFTPSPSFDSAIAFAHSVGKRIWIDETGSDEGGPGTTTASAKAEWFAAMGDYLEANAVDIAGVVFSHAQDGGNWFLDSVLSGGRASPNYTGTTWNGWRGLAARIASPPAPAMRTLSVGADGAGSGSIAGDGGIDCGVTCSVSVQEGTQVSLTATADGGSAFGGWSGGGCGASPTCLVTVRGDTAVTGTFQPLETLTVEASTGPGSGTVTSTPAGIDCGSACVASFVRGTPVTLTASPGPDSATVWTGGCTVDPAAPNRCTVSLDAATTVTVAFARTATLAVRTEGAAGGVVSSTPAGIDCGTVCAASFLDGAEVTLVATPEPAATTAWSGDCVVDVADPRVCVASIAGDTDVTATFDPVVHEVSVARDGSGTGSVTSTPTGIECGLTCGYGFREGSTVVLHAEPDATSVFSGWSLPGCGAAVDCPVAVDGAVAVTATFDIAQRPLGVALEGSGTGSVTSTPDGIDCGGGCTASFPHGTEVSLTATPGEHSEFAGWSGACSGTGSCVVSMDRARDVVATFGLRARSLTVSIAGPGAGSVTSTPAGIDCGSVCRGSFDHGTTVSLTPVPAAGMEFTGWSGACSGTGTCSFVIEADRSVVASFGYAPRWLTVSIVGPGAGSVTSTPDGIDCGTTCATTFPYSTVVSLSATPDANSTFAGWSGACSGTDTCVVTMDEARDVAATFVPVRRTLTVVTAGTGAGRVTSSPSGIDCGTTCATSFDHGTRVTLVASANAGSTFAGWSGACSGTASCAVTLDADTSVTASFEAAPPPVSVADADPAVTYNGWRGVVDLAASGGAYRVSAVKNDSITWTSPSTSAITWLARTGPDMGRVNVTIDGSSKGTVDLYSPSRGSLSKVYSGLSSGSHTVVLKVLGTKATASSGFNVAHDAFVVGNLTTQESAPAVRYTSWRSTSQSAASNGTFRSSSTKNATVSYTFSGRGVDWITAFGRGYGKAAVTIDGISKGTVDLYRSSATWQAVLAYGGLAPGQHTIQIKVLASKNSSATGVEVVVDGFVVRP